MLTFKCSPDFYRGLIQGFSKIAAPHTLMLRTSASTDSSTSAARVIVKYDEVDGGRSGAVDKSSKSRRIIKSQKNLKGLKNRKGHRFGGTFTEAPILSQLDTRNSRALTVFRALFAGTRRSSLDTTFELIIVKARLMELLMLCHVFPRGASLRTEFLSAKPPRPPSTQF